MIGAAAVVAILAASGGAAADPLATLRKSHPRLIAAEAEIARVRSLIAVHAGAREPRFDWKAWADQPSF